jgi:hypothetical protein
VRLLCLFALAIPLMAEVPWITISRSKPVGPREFPILAWGGSPSDPAQLHGMKEAGFNVSGFCRPEDLGNVQAAGLTCFVLDKRISFTREQWEGKLPPEAELRKGIVELVRQVGDHPAALGYYLLDEPNASMLANLRRVADILREIAPDKLPYVNMFAMTASRRRFEPIGYEAYLRGLLDVVPYLSYDLYGLINGQMVDRFYTNLEIVSRISKEAKVPFWNIVLSNAHFQYMEPSDATLHLQAYATLAYGGRGIGWLSYLTPDLADYQAFFRLGAIDQFGNRTPTWGMLQRINNEVQALAPLLLKLTSKGVYHYPDVPEQAKPLAQSGLVKAVELTQDHYRPATAGRVLIGEFQDDRARPYLMVVNKDMNNSFRLRLELRQPERKMFVISPHSAQEVAFDPGMGWLAPGSAILFRLE